MKFIDLFSGLGGFHTGLAKNGHKCVFSCELDENLRKLYEINYGLLPHDDIRTIEEHKIPEHDILCAGFPCQPFSLAGKKKGSKCPDSGKLIDHVVRIAKFHQPKIILLENVPNILTVENGTFWKYLQDSFNNINYLLDFRIISPVELGIPQNRKRIFIVGIHKNLMQKKFEWPDLTKIKQEPNLKSILDKKLEHKKLESKKANLLIKWQDLLNNLKLDSLGCVSIVAPEFGATYPTDFSHISLKDMKKYKGAYGQSLNHCKTWGELLLLMPSYVQKNRKVPDWISKSIIFSRNLYSQYKRTCDKWIIDFEKNNNSWQILEWRGLKDNISINDHIVQFRASGIRILKPQIAPSLIAMTPTQIPIIPSECRYISKFEAAKLQYLHTLKQLPNDTKAAFKALGNAVNARVIELISKNLPYLTS